MLSFKEQHEIMRLAKNLAQQHVRAVRLRETAKRMGDPEVRKTPGIVNAERKLEEFLKEVG